MNPAAINKLNIKKIRAFVRKDEMMYGYRSDLFPEFGGVTLPMMFTANIAGKTASAFYGGDFRRMRSGIHIPLCLQNPGTRLIRSVAG